jgi:hypothetical protein
MNGNLVFIYSNGSRNYEDGNEDGDRCDCSSCPAFNALHAVVELHKPEPLDERGDVCLTCCPDLLTLYPCSTIQAIEKHLN